MNLIFFNIMYSLILYNRVALMIIYDLLFLEKEEWWIILHQIYSFKNSRFMLIGYL